jgi:hypothetical protein
MNMAGLKSPLSDRTNEKKITTNRNQASKKKGTKNTQTKKPF